ncbi:MAG: hypothetical protein JNK21_08155 [Rhodospirillaceae bacterium]|nr:hypothetical protein [Rhodospirillaceae bacterium]
MTHTEHDHQAERRQRKHRSGPGIGTVVGAFVAAIVLANMLGNDDHKVKRAAARDAAPRELVPASEAESATERSAPESNAQTSYKINKGHVIVQVTTGEAKIDMSDELRARAQIKVNGKRTTIDIDDDYSDNSKIKISIPAADTCRVELSAGLLESKGLPCKDNELIVRSGKMEVDGVPKNHGRLTGAVSVGTVKIDGGSGNVSKSSGVGDLRAEVPGTSNGPTLTARVDVGMLTVDVE